MDIKSRIELVKKINKLEGLTNEEKSELLSLLRHQKKYGLVWEDKVEDVEERLRDELPILREVKSRFIDSNSPDSPNHFLIEGDNLEALTVLSYTHEGKIDIIYIDPPYNTGNKDFMYNDRYIDSDDDFRHSMWLSFMNKRLKIAKRLLSNNGVIFISIDDNEQAPLKLLCDEIFGSESYVSTLTIESSVIAGPRRVPAMLGSIVKTAEYCLIYTRSEDTKVMKHLKYDFINGFDTHYNKWVDEEKGEIIQLTELIKRNIEISSLFEKYHLSISNQNFGKVIFLEETAKKWLYSDFISTRLFRQGDKENIEGIDNWAFNKLYRTNNKWYIKTNTGTYNVFRYADRIGQCDDYFNSFGERTVRGNLWKGFSSDGGNLDKEGGVSFKSGKKPIRLIKQLLNSVCISKESIILDFFAGSGTTMHATMALNEEDNGHRRCILVTNNEAGICENITYERNKKVILGYKNSKGLSHNRLRYFKTDFISRDRTQRNMRQLVSAATDMLCIKEDLYTEQQVFGRWKMIPQVARYFSDGKKHMLVVYNEQVASKLAEMIAETDFGGAKLKIYIFSPERYAFDDEFYEVQDKVQLVALPAAIYDAYQKVLPKRRPQMLEVAEEIKEIPQDLFANMEGGYL